MDNPRTLRVEVDGTRLRTQRVQSPAFIVTLPEDNVVGQDSGTFAPHVSDGYWILLAPLPAGRHTIRSRGVEAGGFGVDVTYNLIVSE